MKRTFNRQFVFAFKAVAGSNELFWKSQLNENERDFQPSFWFKPNVRLLFLWRNLYWNQQFNKNEKNFQMSSFVCFQNETRTASSNEFFWKSQFNENKKDFQLSFWFQFHRFFERLCQTNWGHLAEFSFPKTFYTIPQSISNDFLTNKACITCLAACPLSKVKSSCSLKEVLHGVGLPLPTLLRLHFLSFPKTSSKHRSNSAEFVAHVRYSK